MPLLLRLDRYQLDLKDQRCARSYVGTRAPIAICQIGRDEQLPLRSHGHQLQGFGPTLDDSIHPERDRLAALVGAVEFLAVDERPAIVAVDRVVGRGLGTIALR